MRANSRQDRGADWIGRLPVTITPNEFHNLVYARMACRSSPAPANCVETNPRQDESAGRDASTRTVFSKEEYLKAFKSLAVSPKPSASWLGSNWQRQKAESLLNHTVPPAGVVPAKATYLDEGHANYTQSKHRSQTESESGPPDTFLLELQARRRDELRKSREKQQEKQRLQKEQAKTHSKLLQAKKAKLEAKDKQRILDRDQAKADLECHDRKMQDLRVKADSIRSKLEQAKGAKHIAVKLLKKQMAAPVESLVSTAGSAAPTASSEPAQRRDSGGVDVDKSHACSWMQPRAPFSPGNLVERLFGQPVEDATLAQAADDSLKRKREVYSAEPDASKTTDNFQRTELPTITKISGLAGTRKPVAPLQGMSGVRGKSQPMGVTVGGSGTLGETSPLPPPGPGKPHPDVPPEPKRPGVSAWSAPHEHVPHRGSSEVLPAPPPGKPPWPAWPSARAPQLHNLPPPIALPSPGDLPRPPPSLMSRADTTTKSLSTSSHLPGPP